MLIYLVRSTELLWRDEVPHEGLDLLVAPVGVEAVEQDDPASVLDQGLAEALAEGGGLLDDLPTAPARKEEGNQCKNCKTE